MEEENNPLVPKKKDQDKSYSQSYYTENIYDWKTATDGLEES
jgi:hypothetical protein